MEPTRKFKIIVNSKECGTCSGATPSAVAKKVVKKLCGTSSKVVKFSLKECKRGCERVCGPYQGRMEKLDKPYTRAGKKITHRVVCGKVRKMRGGRDLVADDFERRGDFDIFIDKIGLKPHIFFGDKIEVSGKSYYSLVVFNVEHIGEHKTCKFQKLSNNNGELTIEDIDNIDDIEDLYTLLEYLMYNEKLTDYKTIRRKLFELLKDKQFDRKSLFEKLNIPKNLFEMDYLPEVMTADKERISRNFYMKLPETIGKCKKPDDEDDISNIIAESKRSKRPNFFKRHVYISQLTDNYSIFSKKKDSEYYNLAIICDDNVYIGICNPKKGIIQFYPIDENLFNRLTYPVDFTELVYLFFPYVNSIHSKHHALLKLLKFYNKYVNPTIPGQNKNGNLFNITLNNHISKLESILKKKPKNNSNGNGNKGRNNNNNNNGNNNNNNNGN